MPSKVPNEFVERAQPQAALLAPLRDFAATVPLMSNVVRSPCGTE